MTISAGATALLAADAYEATVNYWPVIEVGADAFDAKFTRDASFESQKAFTVQHPVYDDRITASGNYAVTGGDAVRSSVGKDLFPTIRYGSPDYAPEDIANTFNLVTELGIDTTKTPYKKFVRLSWGWPHKFADWQSLAIVKSGFGFPVSVNDGVTVYRVPRESWEFNDDTPVSIIVPDDKVQPGRWVYYTLFFYSGNRWYESSKSSILVPRDLGHAEHLWNMVPPHHQYLDDFYRPNDGFLRQFLRVFGTELDATREFIESWQNTYSSASSPIALLRHVGGNFGLPYEAALGDIRYRHMLTNITDLYAERGTMFGVQNLIASASKYDCRIVAGANMLPVNDDSEFVNGTGNWGRFPGPSSVEDGSNALATTTSVSVTAYRAAVQEDDGINVIIQQPQIVEDANQTDTDIAVEAFTAGFNSGVPPINAGSTSAVAASAYGAVLQTFAGTLLLTPRIVMAPAPDNVGRYAMQVTTTKSEEELPIIVSCGNGIRFDGVQMSPKRHAVVVRPNTVYAFQAQFKGSVNGLGVKAGIAWYSKDERLIGVAIGAPSPTANPWVSVVLQAASPSEAVYAVPYIVCFNRPATFTYSPPTSFLLAGCMFYLLGSAAQVVPVQPDDFLTLNQADEFIGDVDDTPYPSPVTAENLKPIG